MVGIPADEQKFDLQTLAGGIAYKLTLIHDIFCGDYL
jgi:hypothetical protein